MKRYIVNVTAKMSGAVEVEAETDEEAIEKAAAEAIVEHWTPLDGEIELSLIETDIEPQETQK